MTPLRPTALAPALRPEAAAPPASDAREWKHRMCIVCWDVYHPDEKPACDMTSMEGWCCSCGDWDEWETGAIYVPAETPLRCAYLHEMRDAEVRLLAGEEEGR